MPNAIERFYYANTKLIGNDEWTNLLKISSKATILEVAEVRDIKKTIRMTAKNSSDIDLRSKIFTILPNK